MNKTTIALPAVTAGRLIGKRRIYNEGNETWAAPPGNPAWQRSGASS